MKHFSSFAYPILTTVALFTAAGPRLCAQTFPPGFSQVAVGNIYYPTSIANAPDGRIFLTEKAGKVRIVKNGAVLPTPFLIINVEQTNERGLGSIAIDPNFASNNYVYIYYTTATTPIHNRLSRFTANGDVAVAGSEVVLMDFEPLVNSIHNGGGIAFGADGKLYLAVGDDHVPSNAQDLNTYKGKLLRMNSDGSVPAGNPFGGSESAKRIWGYGFRNPFSISIQPGTGRIFVNDVGESSWEEINDATTGGKNFGWPTAEGNSSNPAFQNPVYTYPHGSGLFSGCAISSGAFFSPSTTNYPSQYQGKYFFLDYCNMWINYIDPSNGNATNFGSSLPGAQVSMGTGPDGNLYYLSISQATLYKIVYSSSNLPVITQQPANQTVAQGQPATFSVVASGSPPLSYQWQKNNAPIGGATSSSYSIAAAQPGDQGQYNVVVSNSYGSVASSQASLTVTAFNAPPQASVTAPTNGTLYKGGDIISFSGTASDPEDGVLSAASYTWIIDFHHDAHIHPGPNIPPGVTSGTFAIPVTGEASANVWYRIKLAVRDAGGLTDTAYTEIFPKKTSVQLVSNPPGLKLEFDGQPATAPYTLTCVEGMKFNIGAPGPQTLGSSTYTWTNWSDGGAATHQVTFPPGSVIYTANYSLSAQGTCSATGSILREYWQNVTATSLQSAPFGTAPTSTSQLSSFEGPQNIADNYASRIRGYVCPPATGNYTFWIASDNQSELWISTNDNPANKVKQAYVSSYTMGREWTKFPSQQSGPVYLQAGQMYYIEAIHLEQTQGDNLAVGWQLPDGTLERPIPGVRLSPYGGVPAQTCTATVQPGSSVTFCSGGSVTLYANTGSGFVYQWKKDGVAIPGANGQSYTTGTAGSYQIKITFPGCTAWSAPVQVTVNSSLTARITPGGPTAFCNGGNVKLFANTCAGYLYQWKKDGADIPGATGSAYVATASGSYQVKIIQGSSVAWSALTTVTVNNCAASKIEKTDTLAVQAPEKSDPFHVKVYPNPNTGLFSVDFCLEDVPEATVEISVLNSGGQTVYKTAPERVSGCYRKTIDLQGNLPAGVYFMQVRLGERSESTKLVLSQ